LRWHPANASWTVVVTNAAGRPGISVRADLGATYPSLLPIALGLLAAGAVLEAGAGLLITAATRRRTGPGAKLAARRGS
jgi:hypothetical protein